MIGVDEKEPLNFTTFCGWFLRSTTIGHLAKAYLFANPELINLTSGNRNLKWGRSDEMFIPESVTSDKIKD